MAVIRHDDPDKQMLDVAIQVADFAYRQGVGESVAVDRLVVKYLDQRDQLRGAVERGDQLRAALQGIVDAGFNYPEEAGWAAQEALAADDKRGQ